MTIIPDSYDLSMADTQKSEKKGTVFSCFAGGGGSSMGYKLAGFNVLGGVEVDSRLARLYKKNLQPKYFYDLDIRELLLRDDLPSELYQLDILDGSPPCSSFSIAGARERLWGVEKAFSEGGKKQVLDTLFFDFINLGKELRPKIIIAENVPGLLIGNAKKYVRKIWESLINAGYLPTLHRLNSADMGIPQSRHRVFFIALRSDLAPFVPTLPDLFDIIPFLDVDYAEEGIPYSAISDRRGRPITEQMRPIWDNRKDSDRSLADTYSRMCGTYRYWSTRYLREDEIVPTLTRRIPYTIIRHDSP